MEHGKTKNYIESTTEKPNSCSHGNTIKRTDKESQNKWTGVGLF